MKAKIEAILKERKSDYGPAYQDTAKVAGILTALGFRHHKQDVHPMAQPDAEEVRDILPSDIPVFMIAVKLSRLMWKLKDDSIHDIAGWASCLEDIVKAGKTKAGEEVKANPKPSIEAGPMEDMEFLIRDGVDMDPGTSSLISPMGPVQYKEPEGYANVELNPNTNSPKLNTFKGSGPTDDAQRVFTADDLYRSWVASKVNYD